VTGRYVFGLLTPYSVGNSLPMGIVPDDQEQAFFQSFTPFDTGLMAGPPPSQIESPTASESLIQTVAAQ
jgi:hypothetical protein